MTDPHTTPRDLVVVVPGILGSALTARGKPVWDLRPTKLRRTLAAATNGDLAVESDSNSEIEARALVGGIRLLPGLTVINGYRHMLDELRERRGTDGVVEFPYDWRLSSRHNSAHLANQVERSLNMWRDHTGQPDAKVILIGHSMGGIVARHYCETRGGWELVRRLVTVGTPHRGSVDALTMLINGRHLGPWDLSTTVSTWPSIWELLPLYPVIDDGHTLQRLEDANVLDPHRLHEARRLHDEISEGAARNQIQRDLRVVVNRFLPTAQTARINGGTLETLPHVRGRDFGGDGTVPGFAATPREWDDDADAWLIPNRHGSMQESSTVTLHSVESTHPSTGLDYFRPSGDLVLGLELPWTSAPSATAEAVIWSPGPHLRLTLRGVNTETQREFTITGASDADGRAEFETPRLETGVWRITTAGFPGSPFRSDERFLVVE